jgi:outer membrane protein
MNHHTKNYSDKPRQLTTMLKILMAGAAICASTAASAQTAGTWLVKLGYNNIAPKVSSDNMSASSLPGTKADVGSASSVTLTGAYMFTDHISSELYIGLPYKHNIYGDGAIKGTGQIGTVESLPPTLYAQYRFLEAKSAFSPYIGLGITYAMFQKETGSAALTALTNTGSTQQGTTFSVDSAWGISPQIGATYAFTEKWFADFSVHKTFIKTTTHFSTGQTLDMRLDPLAVNFSVGYRF